MKVTLHSTAPIASQCMRLRKKKWLSSQHNLKNSKKKKGDSINDKIKTKSNKRKTIMQKRQKKCH